MLYKGNNLNFPTFSECLDYGISEEECEYLEIVQHLNQDQEDGIQEYFLTGYSGYQDFVTSYILKHFRRTYICLLVFVGIVLIFHFICCKHFRHAQDKPWFGVSNRSLINWRTFLGTTWLVIYTFNTYLMMAYLFSHLYYVWDMEQIRQIDISLLDPDQNGFNILFVNYRGWSISGLAMYECLYFFMYDYQLRKEFTLDDDFIDPTLAREYTLTRKISESSQSDSNVLDHYDNPYGDDDNSDYID